MAPSVRDGETVGLLERRAMWMGRVYGLDAGDVFEEMVWFLWRRPDLVNADVPDEWLANRCVWHIRSRAARARRFETGFDKLSLRSACDDGLRGPSTGSEQAQPTGEEIADMLEGMADEIAETARAILDNADELTCASSGRVNVSRLAEHLGVCRKVAARKVEALRGALAERVGVGGRTRTDLTGPSCCAYRPVG